MDENSNYSGTGVSCAGSPRLNCYTGIGEDSQLHYQGKLAHEFGHELFQNNRETNTTLAPECGWDVGFADGHLGVGNLKLPALYNIMYGGKHPITDEQFMTADRWATAETYEDAVDEVEAPRPPFEQVEALAIPVSSDYATIPRHVFQFTRNGEPLSPGLAGTGELKLKDDQGQVLYQTKFDTPVLRYEDPANPDEHGDALIEVPFYGTLEVIELYENGVLRHALTKSANAPTVTILSPLPGATLTDTVAIEWEASDVDNDPLRAEVLYSKDGSEWTSLLINSTATSTTVGTAALASSSAAKIRVRVSDGFDTTIIDVGNLQLGPNRPPEAWFWQPEDGATYYAGANVMLLGAADDLEDATIPETSVAWYSDVDGYRAQGFAANTASLSVGTHQIEFRVTDSGNSTTSAYATIQVQAAP